MIIHHNLVITKVSSPHQRGHVAPRNVRLRFLWLNRSHTLTMSSEDIFSLVKGGVRALVVRTFVDGLLVKSRGVANLKDRL